MFARTATHANEEGELFTRFRPSSWPDAKLEAFEERGVPFVSPVEDHSYQDVERCGKVQNGKRSRAKETRTIDHPFASNARITGGLVCSFFLRTIAAGSGFSPQKSRRLGRPWPPSISHSAFSPTSSLAQSQRHHHNLPVRPPACDMSAQLDAERNSNKLMIAMI